ncbi:LysR substrate-binding domain-containing protein [Mucilaginibacter pedocola]|uniref:HTH lysR-type domain-containing protein n=1 Tax=Mucilaginibacter pedocola TaxID=1792845 RepID=A0A1S9P7M1_9SPHI|nr:LysR substrate-binding domain-containing protein [Mucilaginibacter pedocola]OOQ56951.1 hypothetical protein BC343_15520 [Mucilaginibacter pedocola]
MELRQLKYFVKAAELQNFTDAAAQLFITQSTLSQQIKQLEDELRLPLFDRIAKRVRLTEAGKTFLPYARKTLKDAEDGRDMLKDMMNLHTGTLAVGVTYGLTNLLTKAVIGFAEQYPAIQLQIGFGTTEELLHKLNEGKLDMMLSFFRGDSSGSYITEELFLSRLSLIVHRDHPLASKRHISIKLLQGMHLLLPSAGYSIRNYLDSALTKQGVTPDVRMEVNDINTLLQLVSSGKWATVLMASSIFDHPELVAVEIKADGMARFGTITWPLEAYRKKAALKLSECLIAEGKKIGG